MDTKEFLDESIKIIIEKKKAQFQEREIRRDMLNQVIKKTITRIKLLQTQLVIEKQERKDLGHYEDCGNFYTEQVIQTEAAIAELIQQKISLEKWRKKLQFET